MHLFFKQAKNCNNCLLFVYSSKEGGVVINIMIKNCWMQKKKDFDFVWLLLLSNVPFIRGGVGKEEVWILLSMISPKHIIDN